MLISRPDDLNWFEQAKILNSIANRLFLYLRGVVINREQVDFEKMYSHLETWKDFEEGGAHQEFDRWQIMYSLLWCAEQASKGLTLDEINNIRATDYIKHNPTWTRNCIRILRNEDISIFSINIPIVMSRVYKGTGHIFTLVLDVLKSGNGEIFHHPMDALVTLPEEDFNESMRSAWKSALRLLENLENNVGIQFDGRWRLLDRYNNPISEPIGGKSAGGAIARG